MYIIPNVQNVFLRQLFSDFTAYWKVFVYMSSNSWIIISYRVLGSIIAFLMTPADISQATVAQVSNRCKLLEKQQVILHLTLMKL